MTLAEALENYIPVPEAGCWLWLSAVSKGYGHLRIGKETKKAHKLFWTAHRGEIPEGMMVCHKCDTPLCCNPDHLFLGTCADNVDDMLKKDRGIKGERVGSSILTADLVRKVMEYPHGMAAASRHFGIKIPTLNNILNGYNWNHITGLPRRIRKDRLRKELRNA